MQAKLHRLLFYTLVLGVYGIFFSVECFYNFEGQGSSSRQSLDSVAQNPLQSATHIQSRPAHSDAAKALRLNKRYHQEDALPAFLVSPVLPEYLLAPRMLGCYCSTDLSDPAFLHRPLRGPPSLG